MRRLPLLTECYQHLLMPLVCSVADFVSGVGWIGERKKDMSVFNDDYLNLLLRTVTGTVLDTK